MFVGDCKESGDDSKLPSRKESLNIMAFRRDRAFSLHSILYSLLTPVSLVFILLDLWEALFFLRPLSSLVSVTKKEPENFTSTKGIGILSN